MSFTPPVFVPPSLDSAELAVIGAIEQLRGQLAERTPRRWDGGLRRIAFARSVRASNSIEGINASLDDVVAAVDGEEPLDADAETSAALSGYRDAMTYILQIASDDRTRLDEGLLKSLHFMMLKYDLRKNPGRWRPGPVYVRREPEGTTVYEGPPSADVPTLIDAMIEQLNADQALPVFVRAAMAHLNLVMIHPFSDGNGRMGRCLQTLVMARDAVVSPVLSSIEEYLGRNTPQYYEVLDQVGEGAWHPENDTRPWIRFCLTAHYRQVHTHLRRVHAIERLWCACLELTEQFRLPERTIGGLLDASLGLRLRNAGYREAVRVGDGQEISELTASRDLRAMVDADLLVPVGERRGRHYVASERLASLWQEMRGQRPQRSQLDPFAADPDQLVLDLSVASPPASVGIATHDASGADQGRSPGRPTTPGERSGVRVTVETTP
ncbi:MAG: Fic family protein [Thermoleophilia bacterium]